MINTILAGFQITSSPVSFRVEGSPTIGSRKQLLNFPHIASILQRVSLLRGSPFQTYYQKPVLCDIPSETRTVHTRRQPLSLAVETGNTAANFLMTAFLWECLLRVLQVCQTRDYSADVRVRSSSASAVAAEKGCGPWLRNHGNSQGSSNFQLLYFEQDYRYHGPVGICQIRTSGWT